jgi:hypothetical protein
MKQTDRSSCGMACVCMVVHRKGMGTPSESLVSSKSKGMANGYGQALSDRFKGNPRMLTATSDKSTRDYEGTYMSNLGELLEDWHIDNEVKYHADIMGSLRGVRSGSPAIAQVDWSGGGSHFVLVEKFLPGPKGLIVCDPYYGVVALDANGGATYAPDASSSGRFNGWLVTT